MKRVITCLALFAAGPSVAEELCPPLPDRSAEIRSLVDDMRVARDATEAQILAGDLWAILRTAPDARAQDLLDEGIARREGYDLLGSRDVLDGLVEYCPDYAEGYNQRAFASFLRQDYAAALWDIERALELQPLHVPALTGKALTLMGLGRDDEAQEVLRQALGMNPWLRERSLLREPLGQDI